MKFLLPLGELLVDGVPRRLEAGRTVPGASFSIGRRRTLLEALASRSASCILRISFLPLLGSADIQHSILLKTLLHPVAISVKLIGLALGHRNLRLSNAGSGFLASFISCAWNCLVEVDRITGFTFSSTSSLILVGYQGHPSRIQFLKSLILTMSSSPGLNSPPIRATSRRASVGRSTWECRYPCHRRLERSRCRGDIRQQRGRSRLDCHHNSFRPSGVDQPVEDGTCFTLQACGCVICLFIGVLDARCLGRGPLLIPHPRWSITEVNGTPALQYLSHSVRKDTTDGSGDQAFKAFSLKLQVLARDVHAVSSSIERRPRTPLRG